MALVRGGAWPLPAPIHRTLRLRARVLLCAYTTVQMQAHAVFMLLTQEKIYQLCSKCNTEARALEGATAVVQIAKASVRS